MSADLDPEADAFGGGPTLLESDEEADIRDARPSPRRACSYSQSRTRKICSHTSSSITRTCHGCKCVEEQRVALECTRHPLLSFDARLRTSVAQANNSQASEPSPQAHPWGHRGPGRGVRRTPHLYRSGVWRRAGTRPPRPGRRQASMACLLVIRHQLGSLYMSRSQVIQ